MKRKGAYIVLFILLFSLMNSVSAVWIYPNVDMVANNFTLNTITAQNYTSVTYGDTWIDLSEGGNITFAGNITSSRDLIELNGLCGIGNYTTDISIDVYAPADWTVDSASLVCTSNNSKDDTAVTTYSNITVNATYQRLTFTTYDPSNDFDTIDMGFFDANISVSVSNDTLQYSGYNLSEDLFEVYNLASVGNITSSYNSTYNSINMSWNSVTHNTTTFRPNATGYSTECERYGADTNWQCVNDTTPDGDSAYVYCYTPIPVTDLYGMLNHTTETGDIENVTLYGCSRKTGAYVGMTVWYIRTHETVSEKGIYYNTDNYETYSRTVVTNPFTGVAWTWDEIDDLEIGAGLWGGEVSDVRLTQIYAVVNWYEYIQGTIDEADSFVVVRSNTSQPVCPTDGYEVQNNTDVFYNVSRTFTEAYFTVFTYNATTHSYGTGIPMLWGGIQLQCFNESNPSQAIDFDIEITNSDASEVYTANDVSNGQAISFDDIPYGDDTIFVISNSSYEQRIYYYDLLVNHFYNYSFYLPPTETGSPGNTTDTELYYIQVINEYDQPVEDVLVNIKRYINTTDTYLNISVLLTDGNGYVSLYLIPDEHYKLFLTKTGYEDEISEFFPDPDFYGIYYPKVVKIYLSEPGTDTLWTNINWDISPTLYDHNNSISFYFNITSSDNKLEWYKMTVRYYNNVTDTWDLLYSFNKTTSSGGGSITYTTPDTVGKYALYCSFKKEGYNSFHFGLPDKYIYHIWNISSGGDTDIDTFLTNTMGSSPVYVGDTIIAYTSLIAAFVVTFFLFTFSPKFAGFSIIVMGIILGALKEPLHIITDDVINALAVTTIVILGIIVVIYTRKKG